MHLSTFISAAAAFAAGTFASPLSPINSVHEKRSELHSGWTKREQLDRRAILPMKVALTQSNLDQGWEWLKEVSHPESDKYGEHWSAEDVAKAFAPSDKSVSSVREWLASAGISNARVKQGQSLGFLEFDATVEEAEHLLQTQYNVYEHTETGQPHVACEEYSIPASLKEHVDFVYPTVHFDAKVKPRDLSADGQKKQKREIHPGRDKSLGEPGSASLPKLGQWMSGKDLIHNDLSMCDNMTVPNCLRALYRFPPNQAKRVNDQNSFGIVEYSPQSYVPSDLDLFFANYTPAAVGTRPILDSIDGGVLQQTNMSFGFNGESDLDLEYAIALVYPQDVTLYQVGDLVEGASFNNFLDAIDGSYCTFRGGDDPTQDATYPDPFPGGFKGPENCGGFSATKLISTSYSYNEHDLTPFYERRQCAEYMKLGMMGVSVLYSSGDYGVAGNGGQCIDGPGQNASYINGTLGGRFNPSFPGTCPYITAVGATQIKPNTSLPDALASGTEPEKACETVIYSGGGFSNVFALPDYQANAVQEWFSNYPPPYGPDKFNNSRQTRGLPDISANGANYVVAVDGKFALVYGTSASSPTLGSILTLINQDRFDAGMSSIGFINPVAYAHPEAFNDITEGNNPGCATDGFAAAPGWDPVTGLGTPNYPKLKEVFLGLGGGYGGGWGGNGGHGGKGNGGHSGKGKGGHGGKGGKGGKHHPPA